MSRHSRRAFPLFSMPLSQKCHCSPARAPLRHRAPGRIPRGPGSSTEFPSSAARLLASALGSASLSGQWPDIPCISSSFPYSWASLREFSLDNDPHGGALMDRGDKLCDEGCKGDNGNFRNQLLVPDGVGHDDLLDIPVAEALHGILGEHPMGGQDI